MNWIKRLFHRHTLIAVKRTHIRNVTIDFSDGVGLNLKDGKEYAVEYVCIDCKKKITKIEKIADIFDVNQPYDEAMENFDRWEETIDDMFNFEDNKGNH